MSARFSIIPARAIDDRHLSRPALHTLNALGTYTDPDGLCWPSQSTLAERLGVSRQAVGKHIAELVSLDYLEKRRQFDKNGAELPCLYRIRFDTGNSPRLGIRLAETIDTELVVRGGATSEVAGGATSEVAGGATSLGCTNDPMNDPMNDPTTTESAIQITSNDLSETASRSSSQELLFDCRPIAPAPLGVIDTETTEHHTTQPSGRSATSCDENAELSDDSADREDPVAAAMPETTAEITVETTSPPEEEAQAEPKRVQTQAESSSELIFDVNLDKTSASERERMAELLKGLSQETAQQVLDEFNEAIGNGSIKKSTWGWLIKVAQYAREGRFIPTSKLAKRRQAQAQSQLRATTALPPERKPSRIWERCRDELQGKITPAEFTTHIAPLRGREDGQVLWLEAPNSYTVEWVLAHMPMIEHTLRAHTPLLIRMCIG
jgi:DNA-binding MarR family transcriptional regulator